MTGLDLITDPTRLLHNPIGILSFKLADGTNRQRQGAEPRGDLVSKVVAAWEFAMEREEHWGFGSIASASAFLKTMMKKTMASSSSRLGSDPSIRI